MNKEILKSLINYEDQAQKTFEASLSDHSEIDENEVFEHLVSKRKLSALQEQILNLCINIILVDGKVTGHEIDEFERFIRSMHLDIDIEEEYLYKIQSRKFLSVDFDIIKTQYAKPEILIQELERLAAIDGKLDPKEITVIEELKKALY